VLEFVGVMHFARYGSRTRVFALPCVQMIEHVGRAEVHMVIGSSIDCRTKLRKAVEIFQREDLDEPLLAPSLRFDADGESVSDPQMRGYLIERAAQLERDRFEQAGLPQEVQFAQTELRAVYQSVVVVEPAHLEVSGATETTKRDQ